VLFTRRNEDVRPFEPGGEASLEFFADKADCGLFCLASHSKKRPHNLTLGRFFDRRLLDLAEFGVERFRPLTAYGPAGAAAQAGNKACPSSMPSGTPCSDVMSSTILGARFYSDCLHCFWDRALHFCFFPYFW